MDDLIVAHVWQVELLGDFIPIIVDIEPSKEKKNIQFSLHLLHLESCCIRTDILNIPSLLSVPRVSSSYNCVVV